MDVLRAVIFDLDGTLLDTLADLRDSLNTVLMTHGLPTRTMDEVRSFVGNGIGKLVERALPQGKQHPAFAAIEAEMRVYYAAHCNDQTAPYVGIPALLDALRAAGFAVGVVSNKPDAQVKSLCERFFGANVTVAIGQTTQVRMKPAPDTVFAAMHALSTDAAHAVYVGDSEVDLETARQAGIPCISVTWGFRSRAALTAAGAVYLADTPKMVLEQIGGLL